MTKFDSLHAYDTFHSHTQSRERPGTHPNESGTIKYPHFDYLHISLCQTVQELQLNQVLTLYMCTNKWRTHVQPCERPETHPHESSTIKVLTLNTCTDTWQTHVLPHERPGTNPKESGTIKYPHFDYIHISLRQMVQVLKLDHVLTLYTCNDMWRTQPRD